MASQARVSIKGKKQGQFKGEGLVAGRKPEWIPIIAFTMGLKSPRDAATGNATGKRQYEPVTVVKEWGAASPQGLTACSANEVLSSVSIEFTRSNADGEEYVYQKVHLTDAVLSQVSRFTGDAEGGKGIGIVPQLERWSFTFRKIEVSAADGKTAFADDWTATV